jgi:hypothetical protein
VAAILRQNPQTRPNWTKKSPAPAFHAATKAVRKGLWEMYAAFVGRKILLSIAEKSSPTLASMRVSLPEKTAEKHSRQTGYAFGSPEFLFVPEARS